MEPARGFGFKRRPHTTKGTIVFAVFTIASIAWRVFDAWSNLEFIGQKAGLFWRVLHFLFASQAGANTLVVIFVALLVGSLLYQFERRPSLESREPQTPALPTPLADPVPTLPKASECDDKRLHAIAEHDKTSIKEYVWVASIYYEPAFDKSEPYIDFVFWVFNNSLFDIVINFQNGFILYGDDNEQFHFEPKFIAKNPARCWSRSPTNFVIRQGIMQDAITRRFGKLDNIRISFGNLKIKFVVEQFPEMDAISLNVNHYLQTAEHAWHNPNRPAFLPPVELSSALELLANDQTDTSRALTESRSEVSRLQQEITKLSEGVGGKRQQLRDALKIVDEVVVRVIDCSIIGRSDQYVEFSLVIMNCSALPIVLLEGPNGFIQFHTRRLQGGISRTGQFKNVARGDYKCIQVRQELTPGDASVISERQGIQGRDYWFDLRNLKMTATNTGNVSHTVEYAFEGITIDNVLIRE
jgi:hypothetical protein